MDALCSPATTDTLFEGDAGKELNRYSARDEAASPPNVWNDITFSLQFYSQLRGEM